MKTMLVVNLHETEFLDETLTLLARAEVRDCVVHEVDGVPSYHAGETPQLTTLSAVAGLFRQQRNINNLIVAIADEARVEEISGALKSLYAKDRYACSFWFLPVSGYWYHKSAKE